MPAYTTVATYLHPWEAEIARGLLESEGIVAILADENIVRMDWSHAIAVGGVRLQVLTESVDAARSVLSRQRAGEFALPLEEKFGLPPAVCLSCGSRNLQPTHSAWWTLLVVLSFFIAAMFPPPRNGWRCKDCRHVQLDAL